MLINLDSVDRECSISKVCFDPIRVDPAFDDPTKGLAQKERDEALLQVRGERDERGKRDRRQVRQQRGEGWQRHVVCRASVLPVQVILSLEAKMEEC